MISIRLLEILEVTHEQNPPLLIMIQKNIEGTRGSRLGRDYISALNNMSEFLMSNHIYIFIL